MGWRKLVALLGQSVISVQSHVASCVSHFCASFLCYFPRFTPVLPNMCHTHVLSISDPDPLRYIFSFSGKFAIQKENHQYLASVVKKVLIAFHPAGPTMSITMSDITLLQLNRYVRPVLCYDKYK